MSSNIVNTNVNNAHIPKSILLLGAGELGTATLASLSAHPLLQETSITLLLRPASLKKEEYLKSVRDVMPDHRRQSLSFVAVDLSDPAGAEGLVSLIRRGGYDTVVSCTGFDGSGGTQRKILDAVLACRPQVRRYYPWQFGVDYDIIGPEAADGIFREQCEVREILRAQGDDVEAVEWTIVSTGMFMSFVFEEWFGVVEGLTKALRKSRGETKETGDITVRALGSWDNKVTLTAVEDIAKVVADTLVTPSARNDSGGRIVFTSGQTISYGELADAIEKLVGNKRKVKREEWSIPFLTRELEKNPDEQIRRYRLLFAGGRGVSWAMEKTLNAQRGIETTGVEQWLRQRLADE